MIRREPHISSFNIDEDSFNLRSIIFSYKHYWPWVLTSTVLAVCIGFMYLNYVPITYESVAKIKIMDDSKELNVSSDALSLLSSTPKKNLDNEIEILKSYRLLSQVVTELNLDVRYYKRQGFKTSEIWDPPFIVAAHQTENIPGNGLSYSIQIQNSGFLIRNENGDTFTYDKHYSYQPLKGLPFGVRLSDGAMVDDYEGMSFEVVIKPVKETTLQLSKDLNVQTTSTNSEILSISLTGESIDRNETILNTVIDKFNQDGILDRQLISKRTLNFMDERFFYLSQELDSIEIHKKDFKQSNNLSLITADAELILQKKAETENGVAHLQNQLSLCKLLKEAINHKEVYHPLPLKMGLNNSSIYDIISEYNQLVLKREELLESAGIENPLVETLSKQLQSGKSNILNTLEVYQKELELSLTQLDQERNKSNLIFSGIPEKERILRAIERQQNIKENLFLLLLQKREEAAISLAITEPSIKIVDYGLTNATPISPKKKNVLALAAVFGVILPVLVIYFKQLLNTKISDRSDLERTNPEIPILGDVPYIVKEKSFKKFTDRSALAESFRILAANVNYLLPKKTKNIGQIIYVTSTVQGEGKTLVALNLSLAYASMKKRVLLIGADLRNPQLHTYFDINKNVKGLSDYLYDPETNWQDCVFDMFDENSDHRVCFSGFIPPNAPELLSGSGFEKLLNEVRKEFDYVIVDTAPTILVTDTLLISKYADVTVYLTRAGFTDKRLLAFSKDLNKTQKLRNMAYIVNSVGADKTYGYNYGYGYGYAVKSAPTSWYKWLFKKLSKTV